MIFKNFFIYLFSGCINLILMLKNPFQGCSIKYVCMYVCMYVQ